MRQYTTPTLTLTVEGVDLTAADDVYVTISDRDRDVTVTNDSPTVTTDGTDSTVEITLTQEETAMFPANERSGIEVNWMKNGARFATEIAYINVRENLLKVVLE